MKIAIDSDNTGEALKDKLVNYLRGHDYIVMDLKDGGQYPDVAFNLAQRVAMDEYDRGILICGTGAGMAMMANKVRGAWAGNCFDAEAAKHLSANNGAKIITLGCNFVSTFSAKHIIRVFLMTPTGDRPNARRMRELAEE